MLSFLEDRLGLVTAFRQSMSEKRPPEGIGFLRTIGFAALTVMVLQLLSGIALAFHYVPTSDHAYDSIRAFELDFPTYGTFTRSLHHFGASAIVVFVALHMMRVYFTGAYKAPRELTWISGVGLLLIVLGFGFTGYLLPWDQKAYFATKVGTEIASDTPLIGAQLKDILRGGAEVGQPTLTRFYVIHVVLLPVALLGVLALHFFLIQRHGVSAPGLEVGDEGDRGDPYFPNHTFKEALVGVLVAGVLFAASAMFRAPLEALAEPSDTSYEPRPDWYFLGLYYLLNLFKSSRQLGTFWIPALFVLGLVLLPFVDRSRHRHWRDRWLATPLGFVVCLVIVALTILGARKGPAPKPPVEDGKEETAAPEGPPMPFPLGLTDLERHGYLLVRRLKCTDCHRYVQKADGKETVYGRTQFEAPDIDDMAAEVIEDIAAAMVEPPSEDMPAFPNVSPQDKLAVGAFVLRIQKGTKAKKKKDK